MLTRIETSCSTPYKFLLYTHTHTHTRQIFITIKYYNEEQRGKVFPDFIDTCVDGPSSSLAEVPLSEMVSLSDVCHWKNNEKAVKGPQRGSQIYNRVTGGNGHATDTRLPSPSRSIVSHISGSSSLFHCLPFNARLDACDPCTRSSWVYGLSIWGPENLGSNTASLK